MTHATARTPLHPGRSPVCSLLPRKINLQPEEEPEEPQTKCRLNAPIAHQPELVTSLLQQPAFRMACSKVWQWWKEKEAWLQIQENNTQRSKWTRISICLTFPQKINHQHTWIWLSHEPKHTPDLLNSTVRDPSLILFALQKKAKSGVS